VILAHSARFLKKTRRLENKKKFFKDTLSFSNLPLKFPLCQYGSDSRSGPIICFLYFIVAANRM